MYISCHENSRPQNRQGSLGSGCRAAFPASDHFRFVPTRLLGQDTHCQCFLCRLSLPVCCIRASGIGVIGILCSIYGLLRRSYYGLLFGVPIMLGLAIMVYIPDGFPHTQRSMMDDTNYLSTTGSFLRVWYETHRRFPKIGQNFSMLSRMGQRRGSIASMPLRPKATTQGMEHDYLTRSWSLTVLQDHG